MRDGLDDKQETCFLMCRSFSAYAYCGGVDVTMTRSRSRSRSRTRPS